MYSEHSVVTCVSSPGAPEGLCPADSLPVAVNAWLADSATASFDAAVAQDFWMFGFSLPIVAYLAAFGVGVIFSFLRR